MIIVLDKKTTKTTKKAASEPKPTVPAEEQEPEQLELEFDIPTQENDQI